MQVPGLYGSDPGGRGSHLCMVIVHKVAVPSRQMKVEKCRQTWEQLFPLGSQPLVFEVRTPHGSAGHKLGRFAFIDMLASHLGWSM